MPISQARMAEWSCTVGGRVTPRLTRLAVDAVERPDLVAQLMDFLECECPGCSRLLWWSSRCPCAWPELRP